VTGSNFDFDFDRIFIFFLKKLNDIFLELSANLLPNLRNSLMFVIIYKAIFNYKNT